MKLISILAAASFLLSVYSVDVESSHLEFLSPVDAEKNQPEIPTAKYDYKLSFKQPYYYQDKVPFWSTGGDVLQGPSSIRLSPSISNTRGWIWSDLKNPYEDWEVEVSFKVTGTHMHGGRGLAFWYTKENKQTGPIFGSKDKWDGLSVWLDSANPVDHKASTMALLNDGTISFASGTDPRKRALGTCSITYRNSPNPTFLKVAMNSHTLSVYLDNNSNGRDYRLCLERDAIKLPKGYYFGLSSFSHSPADDHDIISFATKQLNPQQKKEYKQRPLEEEKKKKGEEFSGIDEEQMEKIKEAEFQMKRLRDTEDMNNEAAATMSAIYDIQVKTLEGVQLLHQQVEALGAPSLKKIVTGDYQEAQSPKNTDISSIELSGRIEDLRKEVLKNGVQSKKLDDDRDRTIKDFHRSLQEIQKTLTNLETRLSSHSEMIQSNMKETKGTVSTVFKYIFYIFLVQFLIVLAGYIYSKIRKNSNDKKFV